MARPGQVRHRVGMATSPTPRRERVPLEPHRRRELETIEAMFDIYCRAHHAARPASCATCGPVMEYATRRLVRCVFGAAKPTCANCTVHCYTAIMRETVKDVMRFAGPRMLWRHPWLAMMHLRDGRRPAPVIGRPVHVERMRSSRDGAS
jgi:hypothetical protein